MSKDYDWRSREARSLDSSRQEIDEETGPNRRRSSVMDCYIEALRQGQTFDVKKEFDRIEQEIRAGAARPTDRRKTSLTIERATLNYSSRGSPRSDCALTG